MIPHFNTQKNWRTSFLDIIDDFQTLADELQLPLSTFDQQHSKFPLKVPRQFVKKMQKNNPTDPLLQQVLPTFMETVAKSGFVTDPLAENHASPIKGIIHKYPSRILIPITGACMIHCRYCFRQHFDYQDNMPTSQNWQAIHDYIQANPNINEIILSGGDPLSLSERRLYDVINKIENISQIQTIRLHSRVPVVIPERLDENLLTKLQQSRCHIVLVIHCNHANELDDDNIFYLQRAKSYGITLLNQTVLLKNINDNADILANLSQKLWSAGVLPYYLHVLDKVAGASHFYLTDKIATKIYRQLLEKCSGYLVPKLVRETPHQPYKTPINLF